MIKPPIAATAGFIHGNQETRRFYATIGASPVGGKLVSDVNRPTDVDLSTKVETVKIDLGGRDENEVITALFKADSGYGDHLDYDLLANPANDQSVFVADDGFNSNSDTAGALTAVGLEAPALQSNVPGYDKPVPEEEFERKRE